MADAHVDRAIPHDEGATAKTNSANGGTPVDLITPVSRVTGRTTAYSIYYLLIVAAIALPMSKEGSNVEPIRP